MLTINRNGRLEKYSLDCSKTIQANIESRLDSGADCHLVINGLTIGDPARNEQLQRIATVADDVAVMVRPAGKSSVLNPFNAAMYFVAGLGDWGSYFLIKTIRDRLTPDVPDTGSAESNSSPNNSLTAQTNRARAYAAIPSIYGQVRAYPDLIAYSEVKYEDNIKYVIERLCVSLGKCTIENVKDTDTLLSNIEDCSYTVFHPVPGDDGYFESGSTTMTNVYEVYPTNNIDGQVIAAESYKDEVVTDLDDVTLEYESTYVKFTIPKPTWDKYASIVECFTNSKPVKVSFGYDSLEESGAVNSYLNPIEYLDDGTNLSFKFSWDDLFLELTNPHIVSDLTMLSSIKDTNEVGPYILPVEGNYIRLNFQFLKGLKGTVKISTTYYQVDDEDNEISGTSVTRTDTFVDDTYDQQFKTIDISVAEARYALKFQRIDTTDETYTECRIEEAFSMKYYATKVFPGCTLLEVITVANTSSTSGSDRKLNCIATRLCRGFDTTTQTATRSFARAVVNEYVAVAGEDISDLDIDALQEIEDGLSEELARFDYTFDDKSVSLGDRIKIACNAARVVPWRDGSIWSFVRDEAKSGPVMQLDYRNISASGESTVTFDSAVPTSKDGVKLEYVNPTTNKASYIYTKVNDDGSVSIGESDTPNEIKLAGCSTYAQALDRAYLEAYKLVYRRKTLTETGLSDCLTLRKFDVIRWIDPNDFYADDGLYAGEVLAINGCTITTSEPVEFNGDSGRCFLTRADGFPLGPYVCSARTDGKNGFVLAVDVPAEIYTASGEIQLGSRYSVGVGLTEDEINQASLWSVLEVKPTTSGDVSLSLIQYDYRTFSYD